MEHKASNIITEADVPQASGPIDGSETVADPDQTQKIDRVSGMPEPPETAATSLQHGEVVHGEVVPVNLSPEARAQAFGNIALLEAASNEASHAAEVARGHREQ